MNKSYVELASKIHQDSPAGFDMNYLHLESVSLAKSSRTSTDLNAMLLNA